MRPEDAKIAFAGSPEFARTILLALLQADIRPCVIYTQPDRPKGRGRQTAGNAVKITALEHQLDIRQPSRLSEPESIQTLVDCQPDLLIVAAYGLILPQQVLDIPRVGCLNVHASLLPRWRGAAPIARAIENGDNETGISLMQMARGLDNGDILYQECLKIQDHDTTASVEEKLARLGARLLLNYLPTILSSHYESQPQDDQLRCYAKKLDKREARLDWRLSAIQLDRKIRAYNPYPVAQTLHGNQTVRIWLAQPVPAPSNCDNCEPGEILVADPTGTIVRCGEGALQLLELQRAGGKRLAATAFLNGYRLSAGDHFQSSSPLT